jgi:hypothetical protein
MSVDILAIAAMVLIVFLIGLGLGKLPVLRLPRAYSIAVVGYPRSGKTFLITATFAELFSNRISGSLIVPRGKATIEKINRDLAAIDIGKPVGPTTDQDLFAYRADLLRGRFPFRRTYKIEIGDFPGEDSREFAEKFGDWFHETPYFKWAMEANAFVFVIDLAPFLSSKDKSEYVARMTRAIRAAWQHLLEYHLEGRRDLKNKPVCVIFTKTDLLQRYEPPLASAASQETSEEITKYGFEVIEPLNITDKEFEVDQSVKHKIANLFSEIIDYLRQQSSKCEVIFVSAITRTKQGRLGIKDFLKHILPD